MMRKLGFLLAVLFLAACESVSTNTNQTLNITLTGDMLFAGANSLTSPVNTNPEKLADDLGMQANALTSVGIAQATIEMEAAKAQIAESLLLQIVSDNNEMITLGTLSPLPDGTAFELNLAEEIDILPYLQDQGATWVLDVNLAEDHMDEMQAMCRLSLIINYVES